MLLRVSPYSPNSAHAARYGAQWIAPDQFAGDGGAQTIALWPDGVPGGGTVAAENSLRERSTSFDYHDRIAVGTTEPVLTFYPAEAPNGAAAMLIPGGGYRWTNHDLEGADVARVLAARGIACIVLRHRLPGDGWAAGAEAPFQDAQRAMRLIRANAARFGIDPARLGVIGASAGGHLAAMLASVPERAAYPHQGPEDALTARPAFLGLLYPVIALAGPYGHRGSGEMLLGPSPSPERLRDWSPERLVTPETPPAFLVHARDDRSVSAQNSVAMAEALRVAGVEAELHLFDQGGHGFGIRRAAGLPAAEWPDMFLRWAERSGFLG